MHLIILQPYKIIFRIYYIFITKLNMCSIIGYNGDWDQSLVFRLFYNSRIRGLHAFGYSYLSDSNTLKVKKFLHYDEFCTEISIDKPNKFIAHFRYSTSGDYHDLLNNQPIYRNNVSLVFNGVLDMGSKMEMEEKYKTKLFSDNDGELALVYKEKSNQDLYDLVKNKSFAGLFMYNTGVVEILKNKNRPCHFGFIDNTKIVASTKDILIRSGVTKISNIKENTLVVL